MMPGTMKEETPEPTNGVTPKPVNVFYVWYAELCRRAGSQPLSYVKPAKPKNDNVLDFVCDRIKPDEWGPVINALRLDTSLHVIAIRSRNRCKFLHDMDTEDKIKQMKRRAGSLYTAYVTRTLLKSLSNCIRKSIVLTSLELDGVPTGIDEVEILVSALRKNKVIKMLTLKYCNIRDLGCEILCHSLRQMPNIEVLNLTGCGLGPLSAQYIAKVVKFQQINRYCESWHNSLRYEDPEVGIMAGLKRITLNNNPNIGDEGLGHILSELDDDLWIKALDMQKCGITESVGQRLLDVVAYSRSLEIADFRNNDLSPATIDRIFELLKQKHCGTSDCEFKWCFTTSTLRDSTTQETVSRCSVFYPPGKSKSVPFRNTPSMAPLRRMKTATIICKNPENHMNDKYNRKILVVPNKEIDFEKSVTCLNNALKVETNKRIQSELENKKLKHELDRMKSLTTISDASVPKPKTVKFNPLPKKKSKHTKNARRNLKIDENNVQANNHYKPKTNVEFVFENQNIAYNILEKMVTKTHFVPSQDESDEEMVNYFKDIVDECRGMREGIGHDVVEDASDSQVSLINFMSEIKKASAANDEHIWNAKGFLQKVH